MARITTTATRTSAPVEVSSERSGFEDVVVDRVEDAADVDSAVTLGVRVVLVAFFEVMTVY